MQNLLWYFILFIIISYIIFDEYQEKGIKGAISFVFIFVFLLYFIHEFIVKPFLVDGPSMLPTFQTGDYLLVERIKSRFGEIKRDDILVFDIPENEYTNQYEYHTCYIKFEEKCYWQSKRYLIKRVIGLPGEKVSIINGSTTIFNKENPNGILLKNDYVLYPSSKDAEIILKENEYFVMGDNRANSSDSRFFGAVPKENIIGTAFVRIFPLKNFGFSLGKTSE
jgi:signal peptidase I